LVLHVKLSHTSDTLLKEHLLCSLSVPQMLLGDGFSTSDSAVFGDIVHLTDVYVYIIIITMSLLCRNLRRWIAHKTGATDVTADSVRSAVYHSQRFQQVTAVLPYINAQLTIR